MRPRRSPTHPVRIAGSLGHPGQRRSISSGTVTYSQSRTQNYTSGGTAALSALTSGGSVSYSAAVSAASLGTTIKARTSVGTLTATVTMSGKSGSGSAIVYQQANTFSDNSMKLISEVSPEPTQ